MHMHNASSFSFPSVIPTFTHTRFNPRVSKLENSKYTGKTKKDPRRRQYKRNVQALTENEYNVRYNVKPEITHLKISASAGSLSVSKNK